MFRFDYSKEFLKWHLTAPGYLKLWHIAVLQDVNGEKKMVGFISGIPVHLVIYGKEVTMVEINFLCVQSSYRSRRLAPVLIKEVTRRTHLQNIWQAVYTAGVLLPKPIAKCTYYHRNLNIQKLLDVKFTYLSPNLNLARAKGIYKLTKDLSINARPMEKKDVEGVYKILNEYLKKFTIRAYFSKDEVAHWLLPRDKVVYSYVVEKNDGEVTDFISFYSLPSSVLNHDVHKTLFAAYSFFNIATSVSYKELIKNALILAKNNGFDVYNALNIMDNSNIFTELLFGQGDGSLKYYFYNFQCPSVEPDQLSLVLM
jgi:glycylpeptide N-tetradecanoyltransferase